ncbi:MAG: hypothetical protein L0Y58_21085 [Verrucomicrobia subdivision 3 bacterium]|nr:hypothetical protein [Limisphaerales bacterium]
MEKEYLAALWGAIAGGLVSFAIEGIKGWMNRRRATVTASITIGGARGQISQYLLSMTIVNTGGQTLHIVRYGIKGPAKLNAKQRAKKREIRNMHRRDKGCRGWFQRVDYFENGIMTYNEVIELPPGKPHSRRDEMVHDWIGVELNNKAIAFAEDSFGRKYTCEFRVPSYDTLVSMRTPTEQEYVQKTVHPSLRVDSRGNKIPWPPHEGADAESRNAQAALE